MNFTERFEYERKRNRVGRFQIPVFEERPGKLGREFHTFVFIYKPQTKGPQVRSREIVSGADIRRPVFRYLR